MCFRAGLTELFIHILRYQDDESDNLHVCPACREDFECEFHFLIVCPVYADLRQRYAPFLCNTQSLEELGTLLSNQGFIEVRSLATYLYHGFKRRREAVQTAAADNVLY